MCGGGYLFDKVWWWWIFYKQLSSLGLAKTYTDLQIRNFQLPPNGKRVRLPVGESVYVVVEPVKNPNNNYVGKSFIGRCKFPPSRQGKQIDIRLGKYGIGRGRISIKEAKDKFRKVRDESAASGLDPREIIKKEKNKQVVNEYNPTMKQAVEGWFKQNDEMWSKTTKVDYKRRVYNQIFNPENGGFDLQSLLSDLSWENGGRDKVLTWFDREKKRANKNSARNLMCLRGIFEWSIDRGWLQPPNPAMSSKNTRVSKKDNPNPFLSWSEIDEFIQDLKEVEEERGNFLVANALKLVMLTGLRTGTLVQLEFSEIDEENNMLVIPNTKMKRDEIHYVPLTEPMREIIGKLEPINKEYGWMFFSHRGNQQPYMREGGINQFIVRLKDGKYRKRQTAHGFRQFMMTHAVDELKYDERTIDRHLHHAVGTKVERAYNHAKYFPERRAFMEDWSNALVKKGL